MNDLQRTSTSNRNDTQTLLATFRWTTAIGAVSLILAGWGLLSQAEALNAAKAGGDAAAKLAGSTAGTSLLLSTASTASSAASIAIDTPIATSAATATPAAVMAAILLPTPTPSPAATAAATATATAVPATATPATAPTKLYTLDVVQWVQNSSGEEWALVRDAAGTLWYIYGPDVERMEYGLEPEYQPQPANVTGTSRGS